MSQVNAFSYDMSCVKFIQYGHVQCDCRICHLRYPQPYLSNFEQCGHSVPSCNDKG